MLRLITKSSTASLTGFICGVTFGWSAPTAEKLRNETQAEYPFPVSIEEFSWIGAALNIGEFLKENWDEN